jgi:hypothetical protein
MRRGVKRQHSRKKLRERAGVRGPFYNATINESPSSDLSATFSPEGEKGVCCAVQVKSEQLDD